MADVGITVIGQFTYGDRIGMVNKMVVIRGKDHYDRRHSLPSEEPHITILIEGREGWKAGQICLPVSLAIPLAKAVLSVSEYAKREEIAFPD